ncbi:oligoendopeptidase F [Oligoflexus tunisiensis]|uniref:oligoendopeptidase F n=1 Tax=Oligoflexus tunisiensis TaxID=708132 RepID=UPI000ABB7571|nr:oligoendopeptidase F [Oligoflexus tunisiensis]
MDLRPCTKGLLSLCLALGPMPAAILAASSTPAAEAVQTEQSHWNLTALFPNHAAWDAAAQALEKSLPRLTACKGRLSHSAPQLAQCLATYYDLNKQFARLGGYAHRLNDADGNDPKGQELVGRVAKLGSKLSEAASFLNPEILAMPPARLKKLQAHKALAPYRFALDNMVRLREHSLSNRESEIAAQASQMAATPNKIYRTFSTLNHPFAKVKLKNGDEVELTHAAYTKYRTLPDAEDRENVFKTFFGTFKQTRETYASLFESSINRDHFFARLQKYDSDMEASLSATNVPLTVYSTMLEQVKGHKKLLWRYLKLKQKMLGLKELKYSDLYLPLTTTEAPQYSFDDAKKIAYETLKPLGSDYVKILDKALAERWMDIYPKKGKRSGAYMDGSAYDVHPYVLMNYNNDYESVSTFLHEFGHAGHSYLANANQPFHYADYPIFVAEVASTFNEALLKSQLLKDAKDDKARLFLLGQYLEGWRTTVFRQALFADFEAQIHRMSAEGKTLTADLLEQTYLKLLREYYGEAEGVVKVDPIFAIEWAYVHHFFNSFYMFQYTTSFIASTALAEKVQSGEAGARDNYLNMLKAGGSKYPIDLLKMGGVDMSSAAPYSIAFKSMLDALDQAEKLVEGMETT